MRIKGWDERDYKLWSEVQALPSYGLITPSDRMISFKQIEALMQKHAEERFAVGEERPTHCEKCNKPKLGPHVTVASGMAMSKEWQQGFCHCGEIHNGPAGEARPTPPTLTEIATCSYCKRHPEEIGEPGEACSMCVELLLVAEAAIKFDRASGEARLREALRAAHEWSAKFPLQGEASGADLRAAEHVYNLAEAAPRLNSDTEGKSK